MPQRLNDCSGMEMGRNRKSIVGIPWEWELVTKLGMTRNGNVKSHFRSSLQGIQSPFKNKRHAYRKLSIDEGSGKDFKLRALRCLVIRN